MSDDELEVSARNYVEEQYRTMGKWEYFASPSEEFQGVVAEIVRVLKEARPFPAADRPEGP